MRRSLGGRGSGHRVRGRTILGFWYMIAQEQQIVQTNIKVLPHDSQIKVDNIEQINFKGIQLQQLNPGNLCPTDIGVDIIIIELGKHHGCGEEESVGIEVGQLKVIVRVGAYLPDKDQCTASTLRGQPAVAANSLVVRYNANHRLRGCIKSTSFTRRLRQYFHVLVHEVANAGTGFRNCVKLILDLVVADGIFDVLI